MTDERHDRPDFEARPPLGARLVQAAVGALGAFVSVVVTITLIGRGTPWAALAGVAVVVWWWYFYRLLHQAVMVRGDTMVARNLFATRSVSRSEVRQLSLGESSVAKSPNQTIVLHLATGRDLPLDACARSTQSRRNRRRVEDFHRYLAGWAEQPSAEGPEAPAGGGDGSAGGAGPAAGAGPAGGGLGQLESVAQAAQAEER